MLAVPREVPGPTRLGIIASKKVGDAVRRNRAKRLIREAFRKHKHAFPPNVDLVVIPFDTAASATASAIEADLVDQARQLVRRKAALAAPRSEHQAGPLAGGRGSPEPK